MTLNEAYELAVEELGGPVESPAYREGDLVGFFPAPVDMGEFEVVNPGVGPVVVDLVSGEVSRFGSSLFEWPGWLADGGVEVTVG